MKVRNIGLASVIALAFGLALSAGPAFARSVTAVPTVKASVQMPEQQTQKAQTFTGTVAKSPDGGFVLQVGGTSYKLAGGNASKYIGKQVKVTGTLDASTETIQVTNIQPAM